VFSDMRHRSARADKRILRRLVAAASCPRFAPQRLAVELELPEATLRREVNTDWTFSYMYHRLVSLWSNCLLMF